MIHELRIYHAAPGKLPALTKRFETTTIKLWERFGIRPIGFWIPLIGESNYDLYYILEWENLAEREEKWNAFMASPEWIREKAESEKDGPLYLSVSNVILNPTSFSKLK